MKRKRKIMVGSKYIGSAARVVSEKRATGPTLTSIRVSIEVLDHLARGDAYKQIADKLGISIETLRGYIKSVYLKIHVHSRGEAVAKYVPR